MLKHFYLNRLPVVVLLGLFFSSCTPHKNTAYFQTVPYNSEVQTLITKDFEHRVRPDDVLDIMFYSPVRDIVLYNGSPEGFLVDKNGNIQVYNIGNVKVIGLTLEGVKQKLTSILQPDYFKQLSVSARFKNHRIVVLGDVGAPGIVPMVTEHMSLLEVISVRGDLRPTAKRDNILVIRNTDRGKLFYRVNLLDGSVFNSDYYYLHDDDIVYVEGIAKDPNALTPDRIISYALTVVSFVFLIVQRIK